MRTVFDTIGLILVGMGCFGTIGGCVVAQVNPGGRIMIYTSLFAILIGWLISRSATRKLCPQCAEKIKFAAKRCKYCGSDFAQLHHPARASLPL